VPEFSLEEVKATPDSVFEKMSRYFAAAIGYQRKAQAAEQAWKK
jgi:hypothetical protein